MQYDLTDADYLVIDEIADEVRSDYQDQDDPPTADRTSRAKPKRRNPPDRSSATSEPDDELWDRQRVLEYFGGSKPIHTSTLYRGVNSGIYPPPMNVSPNAVRWIGQECRAARQRMREARGKTSKPPRGRPRRASPDEPPRTASR